MSFLRLVPASLLLVGMLSAAAGCSSGGTGDTSADPDPAPAPSTMSVIERCGSEIPAGTDVTAHELTAGDGSTFSAADFKADNPTGVVLVLLHQTGRLGLCGWGQFAGAAAGQGIASVAIDLCGYGTSSCTDGLESDPKAQVDLALTHVRDDRAAQRVVLVGASMGGSNSVIAAAAGVDIDAWVDVSGVSSWNDVELQDLAGDLAQRGIPGLIVYATSDGDVEYAAARKLARSSGAEFLDGGSGHGYELLTDTPGRLKPAGRALLAFANR